LAEPSDILVTLADVATSAAASLGVRGFTDRLGLGQPRHVVICLIDGLGWQQLADAWPQAPAMAAGQSLALNTVFPSTTPTALASLGTGLLPGAHGLLGAMFWLPEFEQVLAPLRWDAQVHPRAVQPEVTVFERAAQAGVQVTSIGPETYRNSGLTQAALRGGGYRAADDVASRVREVVAATGHQGTSLTYVYWRELDRAGHRHGAGSDQWQAALRRADGLVARLAESLPADAVLVVTSDHGMVNCPVRVDLDADPSLGAGVRCVAGEPRARHAYAEDGQAGQVAARWREALDSVARVLTRDEVIDSGLIGPASDWAAERIGDVMAIAHPSVALVSSVDPRASGLLGQHGGITPQEMQIPGIVYRGSAVSSPG
jgi:hypothetical protein